MSVRTTAYWLWQQEMTMVQGASTKSMIESSCYPTFPALFTAETFSLQQQLAWQTERGQRIRTQNQQDRCPTFARVIQKQGTLVGEVIHIDDFGNIITNFRPKDIRLVKTEPVFKARIKNTELTLKLCKTYAEVSQHEPLALMGSHSLLEISMNQGNAAESLKTKEGDKIAIRLT